MPNFLCFGSVTRITTWRSSLQEGKNILLLCLCNMMDVCCEAMRGDRML